MSQLLPVIEHMLKVYKDWYEFLDHFPKKSRYVLGKNIDRRFIQALEFLFIASYQGKEEKIPTLERALSAIDTLKFLLKIAWEVKALDNKKYAALSVGLDTAGKQVGGWKKGLSPSKKTPAH